MPSVEPATQGPSLRTRLLRLCLALLGIVVFVAFSAMLEAEAGIPFKTTYRVACAVACLVFAGMIIHEYPGERWPWVGLVLALVVNIALFFSPLANQPASKGDLMIFAAPDAVIMPAARTVTYPARDVHQRAIRQQLIVSLVLASAFCAMIVAIIFIPPHAGR